MNKELTATNVAKCLGLKRDDVLEFLRLRGYIMRDHRRSRTRKGDYIGTPLGLTKGYVVNYLYDNGKSAYVHFYLTPKGKDKIEKAFLFEKPAEAERERIEKICKEYEKNMRASWIGRAE